MNITLPALRRHRDGSGRRPRRAARLAAALAVLAVPGLLGATLAGPASASAGFTTHVTPNNTFFLLLDVSGGSTYPGAPVIDWYSNGGANQDWLFSPVGGSNTYDIINVNSNMCLITDGVAGDQVYQEPCDGSLLQQWQTGLTPGQRERLRHQEHFQRPRRRSTGPSAMSRAWLRLLSTSASWPGTREIPNALWRF
jgi:hypothetical protein